ncbi:uncharacterized protein [Drosophila takahashii]|uniref:uncharacterized protein n=1 Tax=Drosophila takahashii TaxID=29030 RepID=UPI0007E89A7C|nr:uncharacterized protein LOC108059031 [Drosophila takahashii]
MGIIGTLSMAHKVYSAHWLRETQDTQDGPDAGSRTRGRLPKWHRHRHQQQQVHVVVASPNRQSLESSHSTFTSHSESESESDSSNPSGDFIRTKRSRSCQSFQSFNGSPSKDLRQLVSCWWPLNICHEMRQKLHQIVEHSAEISVVWPSGSGDPA